MSTSLPGSYRNWTYFPYQCQFLGWEVNDSRIYFFFLFWLHFCLSMDHLDSGICHCRAEVSSLWKAANINKLVVCLAALVVNVQNFVNQEYFYLSKWYLLLKQRLVIVVSTYIAFFHFSSTVLKWLNNLCFSTHNNPARQTQKIPVAKKNLSMHEKQNNKKKRR